MSFRVECRDNEGQVAAIAEVRGGALIVIGDMRVWREVAAELLPICIADTAGLSPACRPC